MKELAPILEENLRGDMVFIDAFGGGMNVVSEINWPAKIAIDNDKYIIDLWTHIRECVMDSSYFDECLTYKFDGIEVGDFGLPVSLTKETYFDIKNNELNNGKKYPNWLTGYVSTACSYGGCVWKGFANFNEKKNEDHIREAYNGIVKQVKNFKFMKETLFENKSYHNLNIPYYIKAVIYCDPPYADTVQYRSDFDHKRFWKWVREMSKQGHYVYVSEYNAPEDFECIWSAEKKDGFGTNIVGKKQNTKIEKLFVHKDSLVLR